MNLEMLFHVPFIIIMAVIIYSLSHKVRKGMNPFLYYLLLFVISTIVYLMLIAFLVYITVESSPF
jgi:hypothetical protein